MRTRVKFCGLVRPEDVDHAVAVGVDAVGFVFYPRSSRAVSADWAAELRQRLPSYVAAVGLFVNEAPQLVRSIRDQVGLDVMQFHGDEGREDCEAACGPAGRRPRYWRAVRMREARDLLKSSVDHPQAEVLLLDSYSDQYGGTGARFDWSWLREAPSEVRARGLFLAGGLEPDSVEAAIIDLRPTGVDVSSGIQGSDPRRKDPALMERFMAAVQRADLTDSTRRPGEAGPLTQHGLSRA